MKVLHYVDHIKQGNLRSDNIQMLIEWERKYAEIALAKSYGEFRKLSKSLKPDIVHLHACWDKEAYRCAKWAAKQGVSIALSTYWSLNSFARKSEQPKAKRLKTLTYLIPLTKLVDAFVLDDEYERAAIIDQGWGDRIDLIKWSVLNSGSSPDEMAQKMIAFYEKVCSTGYQFAMSTQEREAMVSLLAAGIDQSLYHNPLPSDQLLNLRSLNPEQWRRIFLYADDEGVRDIVDESVQRLQLYPPTIDTQRIIRYPLFLQKSTQTIAAYKDKQGEILAQKLFKTQDTPCELLLQDITIAIYYMKQLYKKGTISLRHLCDLHILLKYHDYDEDKLKTLLKEIHLYKFGRRIIQILQEFTQLDEGFMPLFPLNDRLTKQIRIIFDKRK